MLERLGGICAAVLCCMLLLFPLAQASGAQGVSVVNALNLPDGSATGLSGVLVADVDYASGLIRVRDPRASFPLLDVLLPAGSSVSVWQTVDVAGVLGTAREAAAFCRPGCCFSTRMRTGVR